MKMKKIVSAIAALAMSVSAFAGMATVANAADTYTVLYGTKTEADGITTVTAQTDFTGDANEVTGIAFSDANGNASFNMEGSALSGQAGAGWTKSFDTPVTTGKVYFSAVHSVSANNSPGNITLVDSTGNTIFASASNNTSKNATQTVATICGTELTNWVRLPRGAGYKFEICVDLDTKTVSYTIPVSSNKGSYATLTGSVALTSTDVAGMAITSSNYGFTMDNVYLYSVVSGETKYDYAINYTLDGENIKETSGKAVEGTVISGETSFWVDNTKYYITADEAPSITVSATGENTVDVPVRVANTYNITVNATGDVAKEAMITDTVVEGENKMVGWPMYMVEEGVAYVATAMADSYYSATVENASQDTVIDVTYTKTYENIALYEDLDGTTSENAQVRASNGSTANNASYASANLEPGVYTVIINTLNKGRGSTMTIGDTTVYTPDADRKNAWAVYTTTDVTVTEAAPLVWNAGGSNTYDPLDTILVIKTGDYVAPSIDSTVEVVGTYVEGDTDENGATIVGTATSLTATFKVTGNTGFNHVAFTVSGVTAEDDVTVVSGDGAQAVYGIVVEGAVITADQLTAVASLVEAAE